MGVGNSSASLFHSFKNEAGQDTMTQDPSCGRRGALLAGAAALAGAGFGRGADDPPKPAGTVPVYNVLAHGAVRDGTAPATPAFAAALRECARAGGGTVFVPAGTYLLAPITLPSRTTLFLDAGAILLGSPRLEDYPVEPDAQGRSGESPRAGLVTASDAEDVAIIGRGAIDGAGLRFVSPDKLHTGSDYDKKFTRQGQDFAHPRFGTEAGPLAHGERPGNLVRFFNCRNVLLDGVTVRNSPTWTVQFQACVNVAVRGVTIHSEGSGRRVPNDDGIDLRDCRRVRISGADIATGDDCVAVFGGEDIAVSHCTLSSRSAAVRVGFTGGDTRGCVFSNLTIDANRGVGVFARGGASVEDVLFSDLVIRTRLVTGHWWGKAEPVHVSAVPWQRGVRRLGRIRSVRFVNVTADAEAGILLHGSPESRLEDVGLDNVTLRLRRGPLQPSYGGNFDLRSTRDLSQGLFAHDIPALYCRHARGVSVRGLRVSWDEGLPEFSSHGLHAEDTEDLEISAYEGRASHPGAGRASIRLDRCRTVSVRDSKAPAGTGTFLAHAGLADARLFAGNDLRSAAAAFDPPDPGFTLGANLMPGGR